MGVLKILDTTLQNIADAIREKTGSRKTYSPEEMPDAIRSISGGGEPPIILSNAYTSDMRNKETDIPNTYIESKGQQVNYNGWFSTDYIQIPEGATYVCYVNGSEWSAFYDNDKVFIARGGYGLVAIPENAHYVRASNSNGYINTLKIFFVNDYSDEQIMLIRSESEVF